MRLSFDQEDYDKLAEITADRVIEKIIKILPSQQEKEEHFSRNQAAEMLHITLPTLNKYTRSGKIKGYRMGIRVLYKKTELEKALQEIPSLKKGGKS
jgi:excisionase family DNA binding protein